MQSFGSIFFLIGAITVGIGGWIMLWELRRARRKPQ